MDWSPRRLIDLSMITLTCNFFKYNKSNRDFPLLSFAFDADWSEILTQCVDGVPHHPPSIRLVSGAVLQSCSTRTRDLDSSPTRVPFLRDSDLDSDLQVEDSDLDSDSPFWTYRQGTRTLFLRDSDSDLQVEYSDLDSDSPVGDSTTTLQRSY